MKKFLLTICMLLALTFTCTADDGDIIQPEVVPDITEWKLDTVRFTIATKTCAVTYLKVDANGNPISKKRINFSNEVDNPSTPNIDETSTDFTDLVTAINNGSNIKNTIKNAVKIKLGLP